MASEGVVLLKGQLIQHFVVLSASQKGSGWKGHLKVVLFNTTVKGRRGLEENCWSVVSLLVQCRDVQTGQVGCMNHSWCREGTERAGSLGWTTGGRAEVEQGLPWWSGRQG